MLSYYYRRPREEPTAAILVFGYYAVDFRNALNRIEFLDITASPYIRVIAATSCREKALERDGHPGE